MTATLVRLDDGDTLTGDIAEVALQPGNIGHHLIPRADLVPGAVIAFVNLPAGTYTHWTIDDEPCRFTPDKPFTLHRDGDNVHIYLEPDWTAP